MILFLHGSILIRMILNDCSFGNTKVDRDYSFEHCGIAFIFRCPSFICAGEVCCRGRVSRMLPVCIPCGLVISAFLYSEVHEKTGYISLCSWNPGEISFKGWRTEEKADAAYVQKCTEELLDELSARMNEVTRPVKRAMTGQILEKLPMLIQSTEEVEDYIRVNLLGCQDKAEKLIVMSMLSDLMRE